VAFKGLQVVSAYHTFVSTIPKEQKLNLTTVDTTLQQLSNDFSQAVIRAKDKVNESYHN